MYLRSFCGRFFANFHSDIRVCQPRIMLHPLIMNEWGLSRVALFEPLLLTQARADAWKDCQPNPDPGVAYIESAGKILRSSFKLFLKYALVWTPTSEWHSIFRTLCLWAGACEHLLLLIWAKVYVSCLWHCHVISHVNQPSVDVPSCGVEVGWVSRCRVWGSITAVTAMHLTTGPLLSVVDEPGAGANASLLWHRSGCQQKAWHGINGAKAAKCQSWALAATVMRNRSSLVLLPVPCEHRFRRDLEAFKCYI